MELAVWIDNSCGEILQYDFVPPSDWTSGRIMEEQSRIIDMLLRINAGEDFRLKPGWLHLVCKMPLELRKALISELESGNRIIGIGSSGWPNIGSIVVNVSDRFNDENKKSSTVVTWRDFNDPHYCKEELSQIADGIEYLIIA